jgi:hypothetical protein
MLAVSNSSLAQQNQPLLQITSPGDGTIVNPGQTLVVIATPAPGVTFTHVVAAAEEPIGFSSVAAGAPFKMSVTIPTDARIGPYHLTALGITGQSLVESDPIMIDVERPDAPQTLAAQPSLIILESQGEQIPLQIAGTLADGVVLNMTESLNIAYSSSDPGVATVDSSGVVTAVGAGSTSILATYGAAPSSVQVSVPVTVQPPVLLSSPPSLSFGYQIIGTSSPEQILTLTNVTRSSLRILAIKTTGDFSETADCLPSSPLSAGAKCTINVAFLPSGNGSRMGTVRVSNSFSVVPIAISLTGTGIYNFKWTIGKPAPALNSADVSDGYKVAFSLGGNFGLNVVAALTSTPIACSGPRGVGLPEAEGRRGLRYNSPTGNYEEIFAKPGASAAGTCAQISLTLNDGTTHVIDIKYVH